MRRHALLAVGLAALLAVAGCAGGSGGADGATNRTIAVSGAGSAQAEPNRAVVDVAVVARAPQAETGRRQLAENVSRMRRALREAGVPDDQVATTRYGIDRDLRRPPEEGAEPVVEYRAEHVFEVTVRDVDRVGTVIDTAVANGATAVYDVRFTLSAERRRELERSARQSAMADARAKARQLAAAANLTVTGVRVIRADGGSPRPAERAVATETAAAGGGGTNVESGPVTVVARVQVVYEAERTEGER